MLENEPKEGVVMDKKRISKLSTCGG